MDDEFPVGTSTEYTMLPAALKAAGYKTHMLGKWHQGYHREEYLPKNRGFDSFFGILTGDTDHFTQGKWPACDFDAYDLYDDDAPYILKDGEDQYLADDRYRERAIELINSHDKSTPMFMYLSLQNPHSPYQVTEEYSSMYNYENEYRNIYYGMISHADNVVKELVDTLWVNDMWSNSIIAVMSDNGATLSVGDGNSENIEDGNYPLKGGKAGVYEGGIRVPAFVSGGYVPESVRGQTREDIMSVSDWYATLALLAGAQEPDDVRAAPDSINMWPYITGETTTSPREKVVQMAHRCAYGTMEVGVIDKTWKMVMGTTDCTESAPCLFDLSQDPGETTNVASYASYESTASQMKTDILAWVESAKESAYFGLVWQPSGEITPGEFAWADVRAYFEPKQCDAMEKNQFYFGPWGDSADEQYYLDGTLQVIDASGESQYAKLGWSPAEGENDSRYYSSK